MVSLVYLVCFSMVTSGSLGFISVVPSNQQSGGQSSGLSSSNSPSQLLSLIMQEKSLRHFLELQLTQFQEDIQKDVASLKADLLRTKQENSQLKANMSDLTAENNQLNSKLNANMTDVKAENSRLRVTLVDVHMNMTNIKADNSQLKVTLMNMQRNMSDIIVDEHHLAVVQGDILVNMTSLTERCT